MALTRLLAAALAALCPALPTRAQDSERVPRPGWMRYARPAEAGFSAEQLEEARAFAHEIGSAAVLVVHDGAVLAAWGDVQRRFMCHSVRKSLLSMVYGIAVGAGRVDLEETLEQLGIDDDPPLSAAEKRARVIDLLRARSGIYHAAAYETAGMKKKRPARGSHAPGEFFYYNNWDFNALATIFQRKCGEGIFRAFERQLAIPLQMQDFALEHTYYHLEKQHSRHPAYPFRLSARDMARLGLLMLRDGRWAGRRILPRGWVARSTRAYSLKSGPAKPHRYGYGFLWWRLCAGPLAELGTYSARGYGGHSIDVVPAARLVFVHRVNTFWDLNPAFGIARHSVSDRDRLELLMKILAARRGAPAAHPHLVPLEDRPPREDLIELDPALLVGCAGRYHFAPQKDLAGFELEVRAGAAGLRLGAPDIGRFRLLPLAPARFLVEDLRAEVTFERDDAGRARAMVIVFHDGPRRRGVRVD